MDTALADDSTADPTQVSIYAAQFAALPALAGPTAWLVQHHPLWAVGQAASSGPQPNLFRTNATLQAASGNQLPAAVQLVVSGHLHLFELLDFADARAPQLIAGNSGTSLDPTITVPLAGLAVADTTIHNGISSASFGYLTTERSAGGLALTLRDLDGAPRLACTIERRSATCGP
jgi:hypothetical protein